MQTYLPAYFLTDLIATVSFGVVAILLVVLGFKIFDKLTPKLDFNQLLNQGNIAMAIVLGSFILGLCYVIGRVLAAILTGASDAGA